MQCFSLSFWAESIYSTQTIRHLLQNNEMYQMLTVNKLLRFFKKKIIILENCVKCLHRNPVELTNRLHCNFHVKL